MNRRLLPGAPARRYLALLLCAALLTIAVAAVFASGAGAVVMRQESAHMPTAAAGVTRTVRRTRPRVFASVNSPATAAKAAGINPTVKPFSFFLVYHPVNASEIALKAFEIKPFFTHQAPPIGGCLHCVGNGIFQPYTVKHNILTEKITGKRLLSAKTRFGQGIIRRGEIGRFKVIGVELNPARPYARAEGCLGADTGVTSDDLIYGHKLPIVACKGANPRDFSTHFSAPVELSKSETLKGTISGRTKGKRWLSVLKVHAACGPTAQSTAHIKGAQGAVWSVKGSFNKTFTVAPDTKAGNFCVYLQSGGEWRGVPDGRLSQRGEFAYYANDSVSISPPSATAPGATSTDVFSGFASAQEYLWSFDSTSPCAATASAEYPAALGYGVNSVKGLFSIAIRSVPLTQNTYRCAYLNDGVPHKISANSYSPTGTTLATASAVVPIT